MSPTHANALLLIQTGTPPDNVRSVAQDLPDWFRAAVADESLAIDVVRVFEGEPLPAPGMHRAAIITGSWAMVSDRLPWSETTAAWIRDAMAIDMPLFGVCYGHQLMAHALGGEVGYHPGGLEIGCLEITRSRDVMDDPLVSVLPERFPAHLTHRQTVLTLPGGAKALASSAHDPHQIVRYGQNALSTQFHPEITPSILSACIRPSTDTLRQAGWDTDALLAGLADAPEARSLLQRFVRQYTTAPMPADTARAA